MAGWTPEKVASFKDSFAEFLNFVVIDSKETGEGVLRLYGAQKYFLDQVFDGLTNDIHIFVVLKARQLGLCYDPSMRVLTADLRWQPIDEVKLGDEIVAIDEDHGGSRGCGRKMRVGRVEATNVVYESAFRIVMQNGASLVATAQHRHLVKQRGGTEAHWKSVSWLRVGDEIRYVCDPPWPEMSIEDAWFGGLLDGEGSMRPKERGGFEICVSQVPGSVLDRARAYLADRKYTFHEEIDDRAAGPSSKLGDKPVHKLVVNRMNEAFRLLGQTRPTRFIDQWWWEGKDLPGKRSGMAWSEVVSIEALGPRRMIDLQTSTKTFICEGFVSHNSTIVRALIVFWAMMHRGLRIGLVYDSDSNKEDARAEIKLFMAKLPARLGLPRIAAGGFNRNYIQLTNSSRISFLVAGIKKSKSSGGLGRSRGLSCCGCTEVSSWADIEGLRAFERSLAQDNPNRLFVWESTARGPNIFKDLWEEAKADDLTKRAIFIGWYWKEIYRIRRGTPLFERYGSEAPSEEEQEKIETVRERYGIAVDMEQLAWYRHEHDPTREGDDREHAGQDIIEQELPWLEEEAFIMSGSQFFSSERLTEASRSVFRGSGKGYRYLMGEEFTDTIIEPVRFARLAQLRVWEEPDPSGIYVIGADPAFGSNPDNDRYVTQVLRCYADGLDQVAEFCSTELSTYQFAWVIAHLCGAYANARLLLEINGPGDAVWNEFRTLQLLLKSGYLRETAVEKGLTNIFDNVRQYMYARADALTQNPTAFHWQTNGARKVHILERLRDAFHAKQLNIRSFEALDEMRWIVRDGDTIQGEGNHKDDRVIALALAVRAWEGSERKALIAQQRTREMEAKRRQLSSQDLQEIFSRHLVADFFARNQRERIAAQRAAKRGNRWNW